MAVTDTLSATRRRNVKPTTSVLHVFVEDVDCSGTTFTGAGDATPEDGQFVVVQGKTAIQGDTVLYFNANPAVAGVSAADTGAGLRMVWGSAQRSDRAALGQQRVPVLKKGAVRIKTKLFNVADTGLASLATGVNLYTAGRQLSVAVNTNAVQGTTTRLVLTPIPVDQSGWAVGYLERIVTDSMIANRGEIEVYLYDSPKFIDR